MILWTFQETKRSRGGGPVSSVADFVAYQEINFGDAIKTLQVTIYSNPEIKIRNPGLLSRLRYPDFNEQPDVNLPSVVFRRKEKALRIKWQTQHLTEEEMEAFAGSLTNSIFVRAVQDVCDALEWGLNRRLKKHDDFDIAGCLGWVKAAQIQAPKDNEGLRSVLSRRSKEYLHLVRTKNFHSKFDVDWNSMHDDAAYLLYHPDLWNDADERMPHGNQLGKGILNNFEYYENTSVNDILTNLGLTAYEEAPVYEDKIKALQVELALAFAHIKKRGTVHTSLADGLIRRMKLESKNKKSFWVHRSRHGIGSHFRWMCNYLEDFSSLSRTHFP